MLRQPIVCVLGHVDHGKTSLLDSIRRTSIQKKEAGAITQHIGASEVSITTIKDICGPALERMNIEIKIPGLLFIDTPGHEAFTNLRERGGSIADIAILVVDINEGVQPQTIESIKILSQYKTPFLVAATKVDTLNGWIPRAGRCIADSLREQTDRTIAQLDEKLYKIISQISEFGINSERFDRVTDFTKTVVIVPISSKTEEGILELLLLLSGLSQKFLERELSIGNEEKGEGSILEVGEERGLGTTIDVILYRGILRKNDTILFGTTQGCAKTSVRAIIKPKSQHTNQAEKYEYPNEVRAACGIKIFASGLEDAIPGSPLVVANTPEEQEIAQERISSQVKRILFENDSAGIVVKADTLGSLEALLKIISNEGIAVKKAGVGNITKKDAMLAKASAFYDPLLGVVLGFGVKDESDGSGVEIMLDNVIYSLVENYKKWVEKVKQKERQRILQEAIYPAKLKILPGYIFRKSSPAIFGIEVLGGKLVRRAVLMDSAGRRIGEVGGIEKDRQDVNSAEAGEQVAISVDGTEVGKEIREGDILYTHLNDEAQNKLLKVKDILPRSDSAILSEIISILKGKYL
ncbi:MAG: translation initiation factor IF-2 [Candidatus Anstonellales archaeon]